jgi:hypothetical protein
MDFPLSFAVAVGGFFAVRDLSIMSRRGDISSVLFLNSIT